MDRFDDFPEVALDWHRAGKGAVLATVVQTWGSAPRPVGSQLAVSGTGEIQGSVSGGCVEGAVIVEALEAVEDGKSRLLTFGVSDDEAFAVGLACGGTIRVLVEPVGQAVSEEVLADLVDKRAARRPVGYVVNTGTWERKLVGREDYPERFRGDRSGFEEDEQTFVAVHNPPLRMVVVGAVHIAQALVPMARLAGYDPLIIDPRGAFAQEHRFPGEDIREDYPDEVLPDYGLDTRTAVVTLSHDPKIDDPAIEAAIASECFYLGSLGSTRTHAKRVDRLKARGYSDDQIARIHAPVGLDIGSKSPAEIAISVMAQITQALRQG
ncbi:xanthine dehydrogenase accessory factor [Maritimibacter alkaliphilus HTCC2654]|uniref:XdhC/CoxI family protein n=1 Tax=Maritimibacter alkaliphilus HTCC2654 TaxID=314271 RepID=A3VKH6_9RHOB|nr:XdhC family protein [Maritimibacter alkaliphilus]EAQ11300.1 XdhC/CoxI family protein [Maritimibacter alkaliphilus HTCC2654]TYP81519.1 xanthine dehydrogenase accessory factor [Maritimibacter alkaliphilus HTCC2654]